MLIGTNCTDHVHIERITRAFSGSTVTMQAMYYTPAKIIIKAALRLLVPQLRGIVLISLLYLVFRTLASY